LTSQSKWPVSEHETAHWIVEPGIADAARFAHDSGAHLLILTHTGSRLCKPGSREKALRDIATVYEGDSIFGEEGMVVDLWKH